MVVIDSFTSKNWDCRVLEDIETVFAGVQGKSFNAKAKVAVEEIFYVAAAAPGVVATNVMVVGAKHRVAFTGTLYDIQEPKIRVVLGVGKSIGAPEIHIPFVVAVPLGTRRRDLLHFFFRDFFSRIAIGAENLGEVTEPRGHGRFGFGAFAAEEPGKRNKHISHRRVAGTAEQRRDIQASLRRRFPCHGWTDDKTVQGIATCVFDGEIFIFHFYADFQALVRQKNGSHGALGKAPLAAAVAGVLFFEEPVHGPFHVLAKILGQQQAEFVGIGNFGRATFFFLSSRSRRRWRCFFVTNRADTEFVFGEECWIERNLVPIRKSPSCFQTHCLRAATAIKSFELCFGGNPKTIGQTHFDLLGETVIGRPMAEPLALENLSEEKCPWWQYIGLRRVGKAAARKSWRRTVGGRHFLACNDNGLLR